MMTKEKSDVSAPSTPFKSWDSIDWTKIEKAVMRLQMRIAKATREKKFGKVKSLQWILTHSYFAKLLAIKRISQNQGSKTPGIDGVTWRTNKKRWQAIKEMNRRGYRPLPLRRIYIPKKNGKLRPLSIPSMKCRAQQALHLLGLEPIVETLADKNAYGFRAKRSCADAIEQCFKIYSRKQSSKWVLEGDIKSCFDEISHEWLLKHIPMDKKVLEKWLTAGFIEKGTFNVTNEGTPQGGIISPALLNLTLSGLESEIKAIAKKSDQVNFISYADDFIVSGKSKEFLEDKIKPLVKEFLKKRGLKLSEEKTRITEINDGFNFLGFNIRKFKTKLLIRPSKENVKSFLDKIRTVIKMNKTAKTENLIYLLNPKIRGWSNYFRHVCSKKTFSSVDHRIYKALWSWARRRHLNRGRRWVYRKYFVNPQTGRVNFSTRKDENKVPITLYLASSTQIKRHVKIQAEANPFDSKFNCYFTERAKRMKAPSVKSFFFSFNRVSGSATKAGFRKGSSRVR